MFETTLNRAILDNANNISIDLETLGTRPGAPIVAIGLVAFNPISGGVYPLYYSTIELNSTIELSTGVDGSTLEWWLKQEPEVINQTFNNDSNKKSLMDVLCDIINIFNKFNEPKPWGNGATFDVSILEATFNLACLDVPWSHWNVRDVRTVVDLGDTILGFNPKSDMPFSGTKHNALYDAEHQAKYTSAIIKKFYGEKVKKKVSTEKWAFSFGTDHVTKDGKCLANYYVVIEGTLAETRKAIFDVRSDKWAFQYPALEMHEQEEKYGIKEISLQDVSLL